VKRLHELCRPQPPDLGAFARRGLTRRGLTRRGSAQQRPQRQLEQTLRSSVVSLTEWTAAQGWSLLESAELLHLSARTLRQWQHDLRTAKLRAHPLGRPVLRSSRHQRNDVIALLHELGPATGVPTLQACFPAMPRAELADLVRRYRRCWRRRHQQLLHVLRWTTPGAVWAMDFAEAPNPIDGIHPYLFAVRDLASGQQLLWLPVPALSADVAVVALRSLFAWYGTPLVLKTDNGSPFCADATLDLLRENQVIPLFSPPGTPQYNGAIEAGIGSLKTRTETHAARLGHPAHWSADDVAHAQAEANATARPRGPTEPTPKERWTARLTITQEQRLLFLAEVERRRTQARAEEGLPTDGPLPTPVERTLDRRAIRHALVELGFLLFRRRRITLPFRSKKVANIT
jgi:transposase InsO family protein